MKRNSRNITLDMIKWIAACMVVFIHIPFPGVFGTVVEGVARFAVPVFFMASGYFSYQNDQRTLERKAKYIFCLYLGAVLLYFSYRLLLVFRYGMGTTPAAFLRSYADIRVWGSLILLNYSRTPGHLWFLLALLYCYGLEMLRQKCRLRDKTVYVLSAVLIVVHLVLGEGLHVFGVKIPYPFLRNFLLMGYPFFALGMLVRQNEDRVQKIPAAIWFVCVGIGTAEAVASRLMFGVSEMFVGSVLTAFSLFFLALKGKERVYPVWATALFSISLFLYIFHILAESLLGVGMQLLGISLPVVVWEWIRPLATCVATVVFSLWYLKICSAKKKHPKGD